VPARAKDEDAHGPLFVTFGLFHSSGHGPCPDAHT
jgi:hypothetical protein